jgi:hypothetical protein
MSLEQALEENTRALNTLIATLQAGAKLPAPDTPAVTPGKSKPSAKTAGPVDTAPTAGASDAPEQKAEPSDSRPVSQADVVDAFRAYIRKHGVDAAKSNILEPYGLPKITAAAEEQLPELLAALTKE